MWYPKMLCSTHDLPGCVSILVQWLWSKVTSAFKSTRKDQCIGLETVVKSTHSTTEEHIYETEMPFWVVRKSIKWEGCYSRAAVHKHHITKTNAHLRVQWCKSQRHWSTEISDSEQSDESSLFNRIPDKWARAWVDFTKRMVLGVWWLSFAVEGIFAGTVCSLRVKPISYGSTWLSVSLLGWLCPLIKTLDWTGNSIWYGHIFWKVEYAALAWGLYFHKL